MIADDFKNKLRTMTLGELCYELIYWQNKKRITKDVNKQKMYKGLIDFIQGLLDQRYKIND